MNSNLSQKSSRENPSLNQEKLDKRNFVFIGASCLGVFLVLLFGFGTLVIYSGFINSGDVSKRVVLNDTDTKDGSVIGFDIDGNIEEMRPAGVSEKEYIELIKRKLVGYTNIIAWKNPPTETFVLQNAKLLGTDELDQYYVRGESLEWVTIGERLAYIKKEEPDLIHGNYPVKVLFIESKHINDKFVVYQFNEHGVGDTGEILSIITSGSITTTPR